MKFKDALVLFLAYLEELGRSQKTIKDYRKNMLRFYNYLCAVNNGEIYINEITDKDFETFLYEVLGQKSSIYKYTMIKVFKVFFKFCYNSGHIKTDLARMIKQVRRSIKEKVYLTKEEIQKIFDAVEHPVGHVMVKVMYYAGLRVSECLRLTPEDVDFHKNVIYVRNTKTHFDRTIPINHKLRQELLDYLKTRGEINSNDKIFVFRLGTASDSQMNRILKEAVKRTGIEKPITNHILRHNFSSHMRENGVALHKIQRLMGHTKLQSTNGYLHVNPEKLRKTVNLLK